jgi:hypothetical protein
MVAVGELGIKARKGVGRGFLDRIGWSAVDQFASGLKDASLSHSFPNDPFCN